MSSSTHESQSFHFTRVPGTKRIAFGPNVTGSTVGEITVQEVRHSPDGTNRRRDYFGLNYGLDDTGVIRGVAVGMLNSSTPHTSGIKDNSL